VKTLAPYAPSIPDSSANFAMVVGASLDPPVSEAPAEVQSAEACPNSKVDPVFEAAEMPQDIVSV